MDEMPGSIPPIVRFVTPLHNRIDYWLLPIALAVLMLAAFLWWRRGGGRAFGWFAVACLLTLAVWFAGLLRSPQPETSDPLALEAYARAARQVFLVNLTCDLLAVLIAGAAAVGLMRRPQPDATGGAQLLTHRAEPPPC